MDTSAIHGEAAGWIDEQQAAALIGLPVAELRSLSLRNACGRPREEAWAGPGACPEHAPLVFTSEELRKLSFFAARRD